MKLRSLCSPLNSPRKSFGTQKDVLFAKYPSRESIEHHLVINQLFAPSFNIHVPVSKTSTQTLMISSQIGSPQRFLARSSPKNKSMKSMWQRLGEYLFSNLIFNFDSIFGYRSKNDISDLLAESETPLGLRVVSNLMTGVCRIYSAQTNLFYSIFIVSLIWLKKGDLI
jgi:hypothetical protein